MPKMSVARADQSGGMMHQIKRQRFVGEQPGKRCRKSPGGPPPTDRRRNVIRNPHVQPSCSSGEFLTKSTAKLPNAKRRLNIRMQP